MSASCSRYYHLVTALGMAVQERHAPVPIVARTVVFKLSEWE